MIFVALWTAILVFLAAYLWRSPKIKNWLKVLWRAKRWKRWIVVSVVILSAIAIAYWKHPKVEEKVTDTAELFYNYSANAVLKLDSIQKIKLEPGLDLSKPKPEIAYVLPLIINAYNEIVTKPTMPVLVQLDDMLMIELRGYKQFKNRAILLTKLLKKNLGNRYNIYIDVGENSVHTLQISYTGEPWDIEQLCALPVLEYSRTYQIDPALLMSIIRHVSNFNFNFKGTKDKRGILLLKEGEGLEQIELGAQRLSKLLQIGISRENAAATFYPDYGIGDKPENWKQSPLAKSWVDQVLADVTFYRENGLHINFANNAK
ncbi:MAG: hypothetical protein MJZ05_12530 [Fibrobacter sp.]|nr:hypothetical protein [Fibrobacter sp.]